MATTNGVKLFVRAKPGARQSNLVAMDDEAAAIQINAPPREGAANEALLAYVSDLIGVKKSKVSLGAGGKSKSKVVEIDTEQTADQVFAKLSQHLEDQS